MAVRICGVRGRRVAGKSEADNVAQRAGADVGDDEKAMGGAAEGGEGGVVDSLAALLSFGRRRTRK